MRKIKTRKGQILHVVDCKGKTCYRYNGRTWFNPRKIAKVLGIDITDLRRAVRA